MKYLFLTIGLAFGLALTGCSEGKSGGGGHKDGGGQGGICPANPSLCGGLCCGTSCVDNKTDPKNCGECDNQCAPNQKCVGGKCGCGSSGGQCKTTDACCDTGCSNLDNDYRNCGMCGKACADNEICVSGQCVCGTSTQNTMCTSGQMCCVDPGGASATCLASCSGGGGTGDGGIGTGPDCMCTAKTCLLGCVGTDCCFEDAFAGACAPAMDCTPVFGF